MVKSYMEEFLNDIRNLVSILYLKSQKAEMVFRENEKIEDANEEKRNRHGKIVNQLRDQLNLTYDYTFFRSPFQLRADLILDIGDKNLSTSLDCRYLWIEIELDRKVSEEKVRKLKDMLSHEWSMLIVSQDKTSIVRPKAWEEINELKNNIMNIS